VDTNRRFEFQERRELLIRTHNETLFFTTMRVSNPDRPRLTHPKLTQPQVHPALLRLSAMISQYFTGLKPAFLLSSHCNDEMI
jgi:hypothetical protein